MSLTKAFFSHVAAKRKIAWTGERFRALNADVLAVQEVWDENAFRDAIAASGLRYDFVSVPGAENAPPARGAQGTPRVGIATRLHVEDLRSFSSALSTRRSMERSRRRRISTSRSPRSTTRRWPRPDAT